jgi:hypothetical protein
LHRSRERPEGGGSRPPQEPPRAPRRREHSDERTQPELLLGHERCVERLADLLLQPGLLVEADLEVGEHAELRMRLRIALDPLRPIVREGVAQVTLARGRVAGPEPVQEPLERRAALEVTRELEPDLGEHREVSPRDGFTGALNRVERRVQLGRQPPEPRFALEEPPP